MSLKSLLTEAVVVDSMFDIEQELMSIKESILEQSKDVAKAAKGGARKGRKPAAPKKK